MKEKDIDKNNTSDEINTGSIDITLEKGVGSRLLVIVERWY
jgi:hypothetical protein